MELTSKYWIQSYSVFWDCQDLHKLRIRLMAHIGITEFAWRGAKLPTMTRRRVWWIQAEGAQRHRMAVDTVTACGPV